MLGSHILESTHLEDLRSHNYVVYRLSWIVLCPMNKINFWEIY